MLINPPSYKDHLRATIEGRREHRAERSSSPPSTGSGEAGEDSFLSVTPSMLGSDIFEEESQAGLSNSEDDNISSLTEDDSTNPKNPWGESTFASIGKLLEEIEQKPEEKAEKTEETSAVGAMLQLGTIAAGVAGVILMVVSASSASKGSKGNRKGKR